MVAPGDAMRASASASREHDACPRARETEARSRGGRRTPVFECLQDPRPRLPPFVCAHAKEVTTCDSGPFPSERGNDTTCIGSGIGVVRSGPGI
jgi:hypothetical protein